MTNHPLTVTIHCNRPVTHRRTRHPGRPSAAAREDTPLSADTETTLTASLPPLTAEQQRLVLSELHLYFHGFFQAGYPYQMPTFREVRRYYPPDEVPDGASVGHAHRRAKNVVSDPTGRQVVVNIDGPSLVGVTMGERLPVDTETFRRLARQLPTHLAATYDLILVKRRTQSDIAGKLHMSRNTVADYAHAALGVIAGFLYADRWQSLVLMAAS